MDTSIDAGVILAGHPGYLVVPLEKIGLKPNDSPVAVTSTCECLKPRLIEYLSAQNVPSSAILLEFANDGEGESEATPRAMNLCIATELQLADGRKHRFNVTLLHSQLRQEPHE